MTKGRGKADGNPFAHLSLSSRLHALRVFIRSGSRRGAEEARKQEGRAEGEGPAAVFTLHARLLPP